MNTSNFREHFPEIPHVFLPVIHVKSVEHALEQTQLALNWGSAHGVWLIDHGNFDAVGLLEAHAAVRKAHETIFTGMNFLNHRECRPALRELPLNARGIWVDSLSIRTNEEEFNPVDAKETRRLQQETRPDLLLCRGVEFKYQRQATNRPQTVRSATQCMDLIVTSGLGTGHAPDVSKIIEMREAAGDFPMAIASGIDETNVADFMPYCDCFFSNTSLCTTPDYFDPVKLRAFAKALGL